MTIGCWSHKSSKKGWVANPLATSPRRADLGLAVFPAVKVLLIKCPKILRHLIIEQARVVHRVEPRVGPFAAAIVGSQTAAAAAVDNGAVGARIEMVDPRRAVVNV